MDTDDSVPARNTRSSKAKQSPSKSSPSSSASHSKSNGKKPVVSDTKKSSSSPSQASHSSPVKSETLPLQHKKESSPKVAKEVKVKSPNTNNHDIKKSTTTGGVSLQTGRWLFCWALCPVWTQRRWEQLLPADQSQNGSKAKKPDSPGAFSALLKELGPRSPDSNKSAEKSEYRALMEKNSEERRLSHQKNLAGTEICALQPGEDHNTNTNKYNQSLPQAAEDDKNDKAPSSRSSSTTERLAVNDEDTAEGGEPVEQSNGPSYHANMETLEYVDNDLAETLSVGQDTTTSLAEEETFYELSAEELIRRGIYQDDDMSDPNNVAIFQSPPDTSYDTIHDHASANPELDWDRMRATAELGRQMQGTTREKDALEIGELLSRSRAAQGTIAPESTGDDNASGVLDDSNSDDSLQFTDPHVLGQNAAQAAHDQGEDEDEGSDQEGGNKGNKKGKAKKQGENDEEIDFKPEEVPDQINDFVRMSEIGQVQSVIPNPPCVTVKSSLLRAHDRVIDAGSWLCKEDRTVIGGVSETFGFVSCPGYRVVLESEEKLNSKGVTRGMPVFAVDNHTNKIARAECRFKVYDSSGDHETGKDKDLDYSDDEVMKAAFPKKGSKSKRGKKMTFKPYQAPRTSDYPTSIDYGDGAHDDASQAPSTTQGGHGLPPKPKTHANRVWTAGSGSGTQNEGHTQEQRGGKRGGSDRGGRGGRGGRGSRGRGEHGAFEPTHNQSSPYGMPATPNFPHPGPAPPSQYPAYQPPQGQSYGANNYDWASHGAAPSNYHAGPVEAPPYQVPPYPPQPPTVYDSSYHQHNSGPSWQPRYLPANHQDAFNNPYGTNAPGAYHGAYGNAGSVPPPHYAQPAPYAHTYGQASANPVFATPGPYIHPQGPHPAAQATPAAHPGRDTELEYLKRRYHIAELNKNTLSKSCDARKKQKTA